MLTDKEGILQAPKGRTIRRTYLSGGDVVKIEVWLTSSIWPGEEMKGPTMLKLGGTHVQKAEATQDPKATLGKGIKLNAGEDRGVMTVGVTGIVNLASQEQ